MLTSSQKLQVHAWQTFTLYSIGPLSLLTAYIQIRANRYSFLGRDVTVELVKWTVLN